MIVGLPKEIKNNEYRVGLVPAGAKALVDHGHTVIVERSAGDGSGIESHRVGVAHPHRAPARARLDEVVRRRVRPWADFRPG